MGNRFLVLILCFFVSFSAHAKKQNLVARIANALGCGGLLTSQPLDPTVAQFVKQYPRTITVAEDEEERGTFHVHSRIYLPKDFPVRQDLSLDATDELNFSVDGDEVRVELMDAKRTNRGYHIIQHLPDHFPYAKIAHMRATFALEFFPDFISEIQKLGFAFY